MVKSENTSSFYTFQTAQDVAEQEEGAQQQQAAGGGAWGVMKTLLVRGIVIYAISSFFRRSPSTQKDASGAPAAPGGIRPYTNIYLKDTAMVSNLIY